jgi:uncharacterized membrane protein YqaE (UPF0057 family)
MSGVASFIAAGFAAGVIVGALLTVLSYLLPGRDV